MTDGESSYAIFLYECGGMEWGGGVIGWQATPSDYESHHLSQNSDNDEIGCLYSTTTSAVTYPVGKFMVYLLVVVQCPNPAL